MDNQPDFAAYLHNPWAYPSKEEEASILCFKRKARFIDNYDINQELLNLLSLYFGNLNKLHRDGLVKNYNLLKNKVISDNLIGLILYGTNISDEHNDLINLYTTKDNKVIELTVKTICIFLIRDYIKKKNVKDLCYNTPNFEIYYNK